MWTARELMFFLNERGCRPYWVGGCVRDKYLGREPDDYDITVAAKPEEVASLLQSAGLSPELGAVRYGTVSVGTSDGMIEITTHRKDGTYTDARHPQEVEFTDDVREDLGRRDFTVNAMALDADGNLVDPYGGLRDLETRLLRCVGDPVTRFTEDALRMLRAARFAAKLGFEWDPALRSGIESCRDLCASLSDTRVGAELSGLLLSDRPAYGMTLLRDSGLLRVLFPGYEPPEDLSGLDRLPRDLALRMCYLVWERDTATVYNVLRRMHLPKNLFDDVLLMTTAEVLLLPLDGPSIRRALRTYGSLLPGILRVREAYGEKNEAIRNIAEMDLETGVCVSFAGLAVSGDDLIEAGIPAGRAIGITLSYLLDEVLEEPDFNSKDILLEKALTFCRREGYIE